MKNITFIDTEIDPTKRKILDIGSIKSDGSYFHKASVTDWIHFLKDTQFVCGHNIIHHDLKYVGHRISDLGIGSDQIIDTLFLSPLLFPTKPYHALVKDDKLQTDELNNPLNDAVKSKDLFYDEVAAFHQLNTDLKQIFYLLLHEKIEFKGFFRFIDFESESTQTEILIEKIFDGYVCYNKNLTGIIMQKPIELAYALSLIHSFIQNKNIHSITPPWVLKKYPDVEQIIHRLRNTPCITGCKYCNEVLDIHKGLRKYFGYDSYRTFGGEALQEKAVLAAINNKSILAVFPTGGGKSITFQVPALMSGQNSKGLTVIISPLQSLMKDQVDNLEKAGITQAVTINGLLDPIERAKSFERVEDGSACLLYISPESLRSRSIERLILGRKVVRFVIDEAHCFSSWGQDFRVDYLYIGDFIKSIQVKKNLQDPIPVSCFTATAKQKVIEDISDYFKEKLGMVLELFTSSATRTNLRYKVFNKTDEEAKYLAIRELIEEKNCPSIIYVTRTRKAYMLAERLSQDGFNAKPYHGKMDIQEKTANQNAFISGDVSIMVATSAFGMGVDKKDVGMVIHYEISDSLENYIQEAGRAGRDENITADCFVLFNEEDLSKHFILLNQTKLSIKEIQQIWRAIKDITKFRSTVSNSALEIARKAGWDDDVVEIETRVTTAIAALEDAGYLKRGQNMPKIFANSILSKNANDAIEKIRNSAKFEDKQKDQAARIIKKLFSSKSRKSGNDDTGESRIDYISDHLGIVKKEVINIVNLLREENILADTKDLTAFIRKGENKNKSLQILNDYNKLEDFLLPHIPQEEKTISIKELNELAEIQGLKEVSLVKIKTIINFWSIKNWIKTQNHLYSKNHIAVQTLRTLEELEKKSEKRHELATFIVSYLYHKITTSEISNEDRNEEILTEFSVHDLKSSYENSQTLFKINIGIDDVEDALFYLSRIGAIKIEGGFLVVYNRLTIERVEQNNKKQYKAEDYQKLNQFYENKIQQIHIVGEYAKKMIDDYKDALQFAEDYFQLNYLSFLQKYFKGSRQNEIKRNLTPSKFKQLFGELSPTQLKIINDNISKYIVVTAGPGSGKTRVLVHKLASLLLMEDVKHEQLLMVTFSRAAATEFKKRLYNLIGNAAHFIEIKTFHSYCFDIMGKVGTLEKAGSIVHKTIDKIKNKEIEANRITKTVLVIDEAQDMDQNEFDLIQILMDQNEEMRIIAVGDDDQNIFEFRGSSSRYLEKFITQHYAVKHELFENYRSKKNLVDFANHFVKRISHRLKEIPIIAKQTENGKIKIVRYQNKYLISPLVADVLTTSLSGTTCILTKSNEEALQISGLLIKSGMPTKIIQSNEGFSLYNLEEIRYFIKLINSDDQVFVISENVWAEAKQLLKSKFQNSRNWGICRNLVKDFETTNPIKKYKTDFEVFVRESDLEDFFYESGENVFVSTIHKAKGKEFDNIFLLIENLQFIDDETSRLLYVAMTRAKNILSIHINSPIFDKIRVEGLEWIEDQNIYLPQNELIKQLSHEQVYLGYFEFVQHRIKKLMAGDELLIDNEGCMNLSGERVLKFSKKFIETINLQKSKGYSLTSSKINFIVYWTNDETSNEIKIILPEVSFVKIPI